MLPSIFGIPPLGFGTWQLYGPEAVEGVRDALTLGYRLIDTARLYENERSVGRGVAESGVPRHEIRLMSKIYLAGCEEVPGATRFRPGAVRWLVEDSLTQLGTDYLDVLLLHWPTPGLPIERVIEDMDRARESGLVRAIGVSNFDRNQLEGALQHGPIACNQVEFHPFLSADEVLTVARDAGVQLVAAKPLAAGLVGAEPVLQAIAARHGRTPAQVALRWILDHPGVSAIPAAPTHEWRKENQALDFALSPHDVELINALPKDRRFSRAPWSV